MSAYDTPNPDAVALAKSMGMYPPYQYLSAKEKSELIACTELQDALMLSRGSLPAQRTWLAAHDIPIAAIEHRGRGIVPEEKRGWVNIPQLMTVSRKTGELVPKRVRDDVDSRGVRCYVDKATVRLMFMHGKLNHLLQRQRLDKKRVLQNLANLLRPAAGVDPVAAADAEHESTT